MDSVCASVFMPTYNQKTFIAHAIEGALRQKTNFPFEIVIGEDCSTDGTREIVFAYKDTYPDMIRVITSDANVGPAANKSRIIEACRGKYIAFCDGDDYWHDPDKLQKQVDFLESHPGYGLVHTDFDKIKAKRNRCYSRWQHRCGNTPPEGSVYEVLLRNNFIATCTACARRELVDAWRLDPELNNPRIAQRDYSTWLFIALHANIGYIPDSTATKRELHESVSHSLNPRKQLDYYNSLKNLKEIFMARFPCTAETRRVIHRDFYTTHLRRAYQAGDFPQARESYRFICRQGVPSLKSTFYFLAAFMKGKK